MREFNPSSRRWKRYSPKHNVTTILGLSALCLVALCLAPAAVTAGAVNYEGCSFDSGFSVAGINGTVHALIEWDDGTGPALFVGGDFPRINGQRASNIARWDGTSWTTLGAPGSEGTDGTVHDFVIWDDGSGDALYMVGEFSRAGTDTTNGVARWDGSTFSALAGDRLSGFAHAIEVWDDGDGEALYVGGSFTRVGLERYNRMARWDGSSWAPLDDGTGPGVNSNVLTLETFDDGGGEKLYLGGNFTTAGTNAVTRAVAWDGSAWSALRDASGEGPNAAVFSLQTFNDGNGEALYAGGRFTTAGSVAAEKLARWDGSQWSPVGGTPTVALTIDALGVFNDGQVDKLVVGGIGSEFDGVASRNIASWDGTQFTPLAAGVDSLVFAFAQADLGHGDELWVGGSFRTADDVVTGPLATWDGAAWSAPSTAPGQGLRQRAKTFVEFDAGNGPELYASGSFVATSDTLVNGVARWDGAQWQPLVGPSGIGLSTGPDNFQNNDLVNAMAVFDDGTGSQLYVAGSFTTAGGLPAGNLARWDGTQWSTVPGADFGSRRIFALSVFDDGNGPALFVGGEFLRNGSVDVNFVARYGSSGWSALPGPMGTGTDGTVFAFHPWDTGDGVELVLGGRFEKAGGEDASSLAIWNGSRLAPLSDAEFNFLAAVRTLEVFDDGNGEKLYAGGTFATIDGELIFGLGAWDGTTWSQVGDGLTRAPVNTLVAFDGGRQSALYAGGEFGEVVGTTIRHLARWDGTAWTPVDGPEAGNIDGQVFGLAAVGTGADARLVVGGDFATAGGIASSSFAVYRCRDQDWGDAPDPSYPTLAASDGARHFIVPGLHLGATIDADDDGQPTPDADGDTSDDGVRWETSLLPGELVNLEVTASAPGRLDAWIDADGDGNWTDNDDRLLSNVALESGPNLVEVMLPNSLPGGTQAMTRFRFSTDGVDAPTGMAVDGEVEDYALPIERLAIGLSAFATPPTIDEPGGEVTITVTVANLGTISARLDTLSDSTMSGDVGGSCALPSEIDVGESYSCSYTASVSGNAGDVVQRTVSASATATDTTARTSAAVPFATEIRDVVPSGTTVVHVTPSTVDEPGAEVTVDLTVTNTSTEPLILDIEPALDLPAGLGGCNLPQTLAVGGRYQCQFTRPVTGNAGDEVTIRSPTYLLIDDDGNAVTTSGSATVSIADVLPTAALEISATPDTIGAGLSTTIEVAFRNTSPEAISLQSLADDQVPDLHEVGDCQLPQDVAAGSFYFCSYPAQIDGAAGTTVVRTVTAGFTDDESNTDTVDDKTSISLVGLDYGDALGDGMPTLFRDDGARHARVGIQLGSATDVETDGQPQGDALGDDQGGVDDEDGVVFVDVPAAGGNATVEVVATASGFLDAWIDFDGDGAWNGAGEQIFNAEPLVAGSQQLTYAVPAINLTGRAQTRFRVSSVGGLNVGGGANDGEVEDHLLIIDSVSPRILSLADDAGSALVDCTSTNRPPQGFTVAFDEPMAGADLISNYRVITAGGDRDLSTDSCVGPVMEDDLEAVIQSVTVTGDPESPTANVTLASPPADGPLRVLVCDTLTDVAGNALDGDGNGRPGGDASRTFRVERDNRFLSAHFDCAMGLDDWVQVVTPPDVWQDSLEDVDDASISGSALLIHNGQEASALAQCVTLAGGMRHRMAAAVRFTTAGSVSALLRLECEQSSTPNCDGFDLGSEQASSALVDTEGQWERRAFDFTALPAAQSASCSIALVPVDRSGVWSVELDELFVGVDAMIFSDGFESGDLSAWSNSQP